MKNKKIKLIMGWFAAVCIGQNVFATLKTDLFSQIPPTCPSLQSIIQRLSVSDISKGDDHSYKIEQKGYFDTDYRWDFTMDEISGNSKKEALANAIKALHTSAAPTREPVFYSIEKILEVKCFDEDLNYQFVYKAQCKAVGGWFNAHPLCTSVI